MRDRNGQQIGHYRLLRLLGQGGYAEVYLGEHIYLKTHAAIKVLRTQLAEKEFSGFLQEAQTIARLKHSNIIHVYDFGIDGSPFLVMDYLSNGTLRDRHPKGSTLSLFTIVSYVKIIAAALQYAHNAKVIHRDVKPENMLLGSQGEIILSDFGIAVAAHSTSSLKTIEMSGTPYYMAPELIDGKPRPASDQYALGVMVYEWLCGTRPFEGDQFAVMYQHTYKAVPSIRDKVSTIPAGVERVVMQALAKDPQQRFATVQAFGTALEQTSQQEALIQAFQAVLDGSIHDPIAIREIAKRFEAMANNPEASQFVSFDAGHAIQILSTRAHQVEQTIMVPTVPQQPMSSLQPPKAVPSQNLRGDNGRVHRRAGQLRLDVAQLTDVGRKLKNNADSMAYVIPKDPQVLAKKGAMFIVSDGGRSPLSGEVASDVTIDTVANVYYRNDSDDIVTSLLHAIERANTSIRERIIQNILPHSIKITCVAAVLCGNMAYIANVGDSRAYLIRNGYIKQISQDHSWIVEQVRAGLLTKDQARTHTQRDAITRSLGTQGDIEIDVFHEQLEENDFLVLCSDGLWRQVSDDEIRRIVDSSEPQESVYHLVERANENGGPDNITSVVVSVLEVSSEPS